MTFSDTQLSPFLSRRGRVVLSPQPPPKGQPSRPPVREVGSPSHSSSGGGGSEDGAGDCGGAGGGAGDGDGGRDGGASGGVRGGLGGGGGEASPSMASVKSVRWSPTCASVTSSTSVHSGAAHSNSPRSLSVQASSTSDVTASASICTSIVRETSAALTGASTGHAIPTVAKGPKPQKRHFCPLPPALQPSPPYGSAIVSSHRASR